MLTKQEMFDRAWNGLKSQGWQQALNPDPFGTRCLYQTPDGKRCAWGWVDPSLSAEHEGTVRSLRLQRIGLAAELDHDHVIFAMELQRTHDEPGSSGGALKDLTLEESMRKFAEAWELTISEDQCPGPAPQPSTGT